MSTDFEKKLRASSTAPERRPWRLLYPFRTDGYHFRKQEQIGPYYVDFACHHASLIIEVDGETHYVEGAQERDAQRDAFLATEGYTVLRFSNIDVMNNGDGVFAVVAAALEGKPRQQRKRHSPLPASPTEGGGAHRVFGAIAPHPPAHTSPLVGEAGRGVATDTNSTRTTHL